MVTSTYGDIKGLSLIHLDEAFTASTEKDTVETQPLTT